MSNSIKAQAFDPFKNELADGQRLRLVDGKLTVEDSTVRSSASAWSRFWTRGQYSQTSILKKMSKLYKGAQDQISGDVDKQSKFIKNFYNLENRANSQNEEFKNTNFLTRFFLAKSAIDVSSIRKKIDTITLSFDQKRQAEAQAADQKLQAEAQAAQKKLDEQIAAQQKLDQENLRKAQAEAAKQAQEEQRLAEREAEIKPIKDKIEMLKNQIEELENCPMDEFLKNEFDRLVAEGRDPVKVQVALDHTGQMQYDHRTKNLKFQLSAAEINLNAQIKRQKIFS